ncbi:unnamed protein product, partial [Dovyalis caffra]
PGGVPKYLQIAEMIDGCHHLSDTLSEDYASFLVCYQCQEESIYNLENDDGVM